MKRLGCCELIALLFLNRLVASVGVPDLVKSFGLIIKPSMFKVLLVAMEARERSPL